MVTERTKPQSRELYTIQKVVIDGTDLIQLIKVSPLSAFISSESIYIELHQWACLLY